MMREDRLENQSMINKKGVTLIELLIVLVISGIVIGGIYKVFIAQTRAYTVQDQVAEVQQDVRGAMEIMMRDIRMAGFQTNGFNNPTITYFPIVPINNNSITVNYEYIPSAGAPAAYTVTYTLVGTNLWRTLNGVQDLLPLLSNVAVLNFSYGIDANGDGIIDNIDTATGLTPHSTNTALGPPSNAFVQAAGVGTAKILAIYIVLTAKPDSPDPDVTTMVSPRTLTSVVTPRNLFFKRYQAY